MKLLKQLLLTFWYKVQLIHDPRGNDNYKRGKSPQALMRANLEVCMSYKHTKLVSAGTPNITYCDLLYNEKYIYRILKKLKLVKLN